MLLSIMATIIHTRKIKICELIDALGFEWQDTRAGCPYLPLFVLEDRDFRI